MKLYKYDTHVHTKEGSRCSGTEGAAHARRYKSLGYDGIFITDHFLAGSCTVAHDIPWNDKINLFCKGYENAKAEGDKIGLKVFFGFESSFFGLDILTYGLDKEFLLANHEILGFLENDDIKGYCKFVRQNGGMTVHAHPFREASYIPCIRLFPYDIDAVEVVNSNNLDQRFNDRAEYYAKSYGRPETAGTDTHNHYNEKPVTGGILSSFELSCEKDYINLVMNREIKKLCI